MITGQMEPHRAVRPPVQPAHIIPAAHVDQHAIHPAVWRQHVPAPADTPAGLLRQLHELGTVARLDLITAALEAARRDGAAQALEGLADALQEKARDEQASRHPDAAWAYATANAAGVARDRAALHRAGQL